MTNRIQSILIKTLLLCSATASAAPDPFAEVEVTAARVAGPVHMLTGAGGNIAVTVGEDGVLIVDDQFLPLAERIQGAINELGGDRPKFVLNTHYHGDHVGGNPHFGQAATIIAHRNVRTRLAADGGAAAGRPAGGDLRRRDERALQWRGNRAPSPPRRAHRRGQRGLVQVFQRAALGRSTVQRSLPLHRP